MKITDWLAVYAAILSSMVFIWNVLQSRPKYKVKIFTSFETVDGLLTGGVSVIILNTSQKPVHLSNILFLYKERTPTIYERIHYIYKYKTVRYVGWVRIYLQMFGVNDKCPATIEPYKSLSVFVAREDVERLIRGSSSRVFRAIVQDALWRENRSAKFHYPPRPQSIGTHTTSANDSENTEDDITLDAS